MRPTPPSRSGHLPRHLLNLGLLLAGLASASSGLTLQLRYHIGRHGHGEGASFGYPFWAQLHKYSSVLLLGLVVWHLVVNWKWARAVWRKSLLGKHRQVVTMSLLFLAAAVTGLGAWVLGWAGVEFRAEKLVIEIHDKLTLFLTVFLVLHVWSRRRRLVS